MNQYTLKALTALDEQIVTAEERLNAAMLSMGSGASADNNTWHDNPAFEQAKMDVEQARVELNRLRDLRRDAEVVESTNSDEIEVGSMAVIQFTNDTRSMKILIGGHYVVRNALDKDVMEISTTSPLGAALLRRKAGETVSYLAPNGNRMEVSILELV